MICNFCPNGVGPLRTDKTLVEDPQYVGPEGHSREECLECYCYACQKRRAEFSRWDLGSGKVRRALSFMTEGFTQKEAAQKVGMTTRTLQRRMKKLRGNPEMLAELGLFYVYRG